MKRQALTLLVLQLLCLCSEYTHVQAEELDFGPQDPNAEKLVQQLGSEDFAIRAQAFGALKALGPQAGKALTAAVNSPDVEIKSCVAELLPKASELARGRKDFERWKASLKHAWPEALKEGRLSGPLLGALDLGPLPHSLENEAAMKDELDFPNNTERSLHWLAAVQEADGHWNSRKFGAQQNADIEQTSLALLAFEGAGHTEKVGRYKATVKNAVSWLKKYQREDGAILAAGWDEPDGVVHALAGMALCEAAGMARIPDTIACAQKALKYSTNQHQTRLPNAPDGSEVFSGYGRSARSTPDLFTTGLFMMQLKAGKCAGLELKTETVHGIIAYVKTIKSTSDALAEDGGKPGLYAWVPGGKTSILATWFALNTLRSTGSKREEIIGTTLLTAKESDGPSMGKAGSDILANYFGSMVLFNNGGEAWSHWNDQHNKACLESQNTEGPKTGSWNPAGQWMGAGRITTTAFTALSLEVYYIYAIPAPKF